MILIPELNKKIEEHKIREKAVIDFLSLVAKESNIVFYKDKDSEYIVPLRIQLIISFSLLDMFANYWYEYKCESGTPKQRMTDWYGKYCMTNQNSVFRCDDQLLKISPERLYKFRNALVHFFGLGAVVPGELYIGLVSNDLPKEESEKMRTAFVMHGHPTVIIKPIDFHSMIKEGAILMLEEWASVIEQSKSDQTKVLQYIDAIKRVYDKVQNEGASEVKKKK